MEDKFLSDLVTMPSSFLASKWILERIPFVFNQNNDLYIEWKEKLSELIKIDSSAIIFTGSAGCGLSLNPNKSFKLFDDDSDIDLALISNHYFDVAWYTLRNLGTKYYTLEPKAKSAIDDHVHRLIYWGTIATDKILGILPFGKTWTIALDKMGQEAPFDSRIINIRIYKDFESLRKYQTNNLEKLKVKQLGE